MEYHLRRKHAILAPSSSEPLKQPSILQSLNKKPKLSVEYQLLEDLVGWIIEDKMPFSVIESPLFRRMLNNSSPHGLDFQLFSRATLKTRIEAKFQKHRLRLKQELALTCRSIALSFGIWISDDNLPAIAIIGHWLTPEFSYKQKLLEFTELKWHISGENIADAVFDVLSELDLQEKLLAITGDHNTSDTENWMMASTLHGSLLPNNSQFQALASHTHCLTKTLDLIVKNILRALETATIEEASRICEQLRTKNGDDLSVKTVLSRVQIFTFWVSGIPREKYAWNRVCAHVDSDLSDRLIKHDMETRWRPTYQMLDTVLCLKPQINQYLDEQSNFPQFTEEDWRILSQIHRVLARFHKLTLRISQREPQISMAMPIYSALHVLLHQGDEKQGIFADLDIDIAAAVHQSLVKYQKYYTFMDDTKAYHAAFILDPRVKGHFLLKQLSDSEAGQMIVDTTRERIHQKYYDHAAVDKQSSSPAPHPDSFELYDLEMDMLRQLRQVDREKGRTDIDHYFTTAPIQMAGDVSKDREWLAKWWYARRDSMPHMAAAARDYLAIPASGVAVQRLLDEFGDFLELRREGVMDEMRMSILMDGTL